MKKQEEPPVNLSELLVERIVEDLVTRKQWDVKETLAVNDECEIDISNEFVALNIFAWDLSLNQQLGTPMRDTVMDLVSEKYGAIFDDEEGADFADERMVEYGMFLREVTAVGKGVSESTGATFAKIVGGGKVNPTTWLAASKVFLLLLTENKEYFDEIKSLLNERT